MSNTKVGQLLNKFEEESKMTKTQVNKIVYDLIGRSIGRSEDKNGDETRSFNPKNGTRIGQFGGGSFNRPWEMLSTAFDRFSQGIRSHEHLRVVERNDYSMTLRWDDEFEYVLVGVERAQYSRNDYGSPSSSLLWCVCNSSKVKK